MSSADWSKDGSLLVVGGSSSVVTVQHYESGHSFSTSIIPQVKALNLKL